MKKLGIDFARTPLEIASERAALKREYLECLCGMREDADSLCSLVKRLVALRVGRHTLVCWAIEAGFAEKYIRSLLSRIFAEEGSRMRKAGAGPKTPREALELLGIATDRYGGRAEKLLRAAARAARKRRETLAARPQGVSEGNSLASASLLISYTNKAGSPLSSSLTCDWPISGSGAQGFVLRPSVHQ